MPAYAEIVLRFIPAHAGDTFSRSRTCPIDAVHPRTYGGIRQPGHQSGDIDRLIPACAGDTSSWNASRRSAPVHPRAYGGYTQIFVLRDLSNSSSPRMRGMLHNEDGGGVAVRFIPVRTGGTPHTQRRHEPAHGSSPHIRGKQANNKWFIPACAGDTRIMNSAPRRPPVHPRAHGGYLKPKDSSLSANGSSPRTRGILSGACPHPHCPWFIPACAGDTIPSLLTG